MNKAADRAAVSPIPAKLSGVANVTAGPAEWTAVAGARTSAASSEANGVRRLAKFTMALLLFV